MQETLNKKYALWPLIFKALLRNLHKIQINTLLTNYQMEMKSH